MGEGNIPPAGRAAYESGPRLGVPWDEADALHRELAARGYPATLCAEARTRTAQLELWPGVDPDAAAAALGELLRQRHVG
jgi:hypothetical protein